jgi:hypothetical protein
MLPDTGRRSKALSQHLQIGLLSAYATGFELRRRHGQRPMAAQHEVQVDQPTMQTLVIGLTEPPFAGIWKIARCYR